MKIMGMVQIFLDVVITLIYFFPLLYLWHTKNLCYQFVSFLLNSWCFIVKNLFSLKHTKAHVYYWWCTSNCTFLLIKQSFIVKNTFIAFVEPWLFFQVGWGYEVLLNTTISIRVNVCRSQTLIMNKSFIILW